MEQTANTTDSSLARNTRRAYTSDWADFSAWCQNRGAKSMPGSPETVARYLSELAETHKLSTLQRRMVSITYAHKEAGLKTPVVDPIVRAEWDRITRPRDANTSKRSQDSWAQRLARVKGASDLMFH